MSDNEVVDIPTRNETIFKMIQDKVDPMEVARQLHMSRTHVVRVYYEMLQKKMKGDPDIPEIDKVCRIFEVRENYRGKLQSILHTNGYTNFDDIWIWTDMDTFREIPEIGPKSICIIWLAQHMKRD